VASVEQFDIFANPLKVSCMGDPNLNGREYSADVLVAAAKQMCSGTGLPSLQLLDHAARLGIDPVAPGRDETAAMLCAVGEINAKTLTIDLSVEAAAFCRKEEQQTRDNVLGAWLAGHPYVVDLGSSDMLMARKITDGTVPKLLAEKLSANKIHPAFGLLSDCNLGLAEDGTQDECKESIERALDTAVDNHLRIITQGLAAYQMKVVEHTIEYTPPRLRIKVKTARPRIQVNGIMTGGVVRRLMNAWVTAVVSNSDCHPKDHFSKTYEYHSGMMRHEKKSADENEGVHVERDDEEVTHFDITTHLAKRFKEVYGTVSGRIQPPRPLVYNA
jgi:hypothetical protein